MENTGTQAHNDLNPSLKLALLISIIQSKLQKNRPPSSSSNQDPTTVRGTNASESDAIKWKLKAKQRKVEILRLKEDLKIAEDGMQLDVFPQTALCKCYFFDNLGELSTTCSMDGCESEQKGFNDVLRRRFLRQVRLSDRRMRRLGGALERSHIPDNFGENNLDQLTAAIDFLVELCETSSPLSVRSDNGAPIRPLKLDADESSFFWDPWLDAIQFMIALLYILQADEGQFKNWSHQAVDFILGTLKALPSEGNIGETVEKVLSSMIIRLLHRMCNATQANEMHYSLQKFEFYVQHLMRKLGRDPYVGQHVILAVAHRISVVSESLLFMDPFDAGFPKMHNCMYIMIQLIECLVTDYLLSWSTCEGFDTRLLEEWVTSIFRARKSLELLESRNLLYMLYMDRVIGELTRQLGQVSAQLKLPPDTFTKFFG